MFPGLTTRISESKIALGTTIYPKTDLIFVTDTTTTTVCQTIVPPYGGFSGILFIVNKSGNTFTIGTTGNVPLGLTVLADDAGTLTYSKLYSEWRPQSI